MTNAANNTFFILQRQLVEDINEAAATELAIFENFGETEIVIAMVEAEIRHSPLMAYRLGKYQRSVSEESVKE